MKIEKITIKNFRAFKEETIEMLDYTSFVGANGTGKSTVLAALNLFFGEACSQGLGSFSVDVDDFHKKDVSKEIEISITFSDLSTEEADSLSAYVRHNKLIVTTKAYFDENSGKGTALQFGSRLAMKELAPFFEAEVEGKKVTELKDLYNAIKAKYSELPPPGTKEVMKAALRAFEESNPALCVEIPSSDQFYGIEKVGRLNKFIQWVYIPAVKDAYEEQRESKAGALGKLLARSVRSKVNFDDKIKTIQENARIEYEKLMGEHQSVLTDISASLRTRLADWSHPEVRLKVEWASDPQKSVLVAAPFAQLRAGEGEFEGQLSRLGHGLQRSYIIALLQELATTSITGEQPRLILGCEEPELYQHPPQIRHLASALLKLSNKNSQVIVTTHSPFFVSGETFDSARICRQEVAGVKVLKVEKPKIVEALKRYDKSLKGDVGLRAKLYQVLQPQLSEMFFSKKLIFVEGIEDQAFILGLLEYFEKAEPYRSSGAHIIPVNGKSNLIPPMIIASHLQIPFMVVFDADSSTPEADGKRAKHEKDNKAILEIVGLKAPPFPLGHMFEERAVIWKENIGDAFAEDCGEKHGKIKEKAAQNLDQLSGLDKNILAIAERISVAKDEGLKLLIMEKLVSQIEKFCKAG